ncbi:MAG TPA: Hsp20/alpha crystallin family protein [Caulobacteraceae bacterium]|jgi:HSP20 family protein|nr:Hsp20/alpha crystallin family protein [Caulobacteraceae bacterium]
MADTQPQTSATGTGGQATPSRGGAAAAGAGASAKAASAQSERKDAGPAGPSDAAAAVRTAGTRAGDAAEAAGQVSQAAAGATREAGERGRNALRESAESWRGAAEPFLSMQSELNHWFDDLWRQATGMGMLPSLRPSRPFAALSAASMFGLPAVDLKETDEAYKICAELPGLRPEDIELEIKGEALVLTGHKTEEKDDHRAAYRISERRFGRFERRFPLPPDVDRGKIEAAFHDGVLTVTLPREASAERLGNRIQIRG